jgi:hypothetical protein
MKTLQEQYNSIKKGKGHKGVFLKEAKRLFPNIVPNFATFDQATKLLKQRSVISENNDPSKNIITEAEAKATEKKTLKSINEKETAGYDYKNKKNLDNQIFDQYLNGLYVEMKKDSKLTLDEARDIVAKNLEKDSLFYMKNAAFGVEGIGYETSKESKEPTGKYKSSGYGDLKENKMNKSDKLKELLEEAVAGIPSIGNPFADRPKQAYENKFLAFLNEAEEEVEEGEAAYEYEKGKKAGEAKEKKEMKKEGKGRMKMSEVLKEAERLGEIARKKVEAKIYERAIAERKAACSINEDESLSEFINQSAIQEVEKEIKELEKKLMEVTADKNNMTGGK